MKDTDGRSLSEEINVRGTELVDKVKELIAQGNVRRLVVRRPTGEALVEIPLTAGVGIAGLLTLMAPVLAALAAMAALLSDFRVQIEREAPKDEQTLAYDDADGETDGESK